MSDIKPGSDAEVFDRARYWKNVYSKRAMGNVTGTNDMLDRQNMLLAIGLAEDAEIYRIKSENSEIKKSQWRG